MGWAVLEHPDFARERAALDEPVSDKLDAIILALESSGPRLGRPLVDTLKGSRHTNLKEIRFSMKGAWRFAFAFDVERRAIILVGGNKEGQSQNKFYRMLIGIADKRFAEWLEAET